MLRLTNMFPSRWPLDICRRYCFEFLLASACCHWQGGRKSVSTFCDSKRQLLIEARCGASLPSARNREVLRKLTVS